MNMHSDVIVAGSGIAGLMAAYLAAKQGLNVTLLERSPSLGGVMQGFKWEGTHFDFGCHLFGNDQNQSTALLHEIMDNELAPVDLKVASLYHGKLTEGFELPDLTSLSNDIKQQFLTEAGSKSITKGTIKDWLSGRYGQTITPFLLEIVEKIFLIPATELSQQGYPALPFRRLRLFDDEKARMLKKEKKWDDLIAQTPQESSLPRAFYPLGTGMSHFIKKAEEKLLELDVKIIRNCKLSDLQKEKNTFTLISDTHEYTAHKLIWTAGLVNLAHSVEVLKKQSDKVEAQIQKVPMILYYFIFSKENEGNLSYLQCFDKGQPFYRMSVPGRYGDKNCQPGESYLCVEAPTTLNSSHWNQPEKFTGELWEKACSYGLVNYGSSYLKATTKKTPISYKVPRIGYADNAAPILKFAHENGIILSEEWSFTKGNLLTQLLKEIGPEKAA